MNEADGKFSRADAARMAAFDVANGHRRDALTEQLIADARAPAESPQPAPTGAERLLPSESGGPECNHVLWTMGCSPCVDWAVANGVAFARHMAARRSELAPRTVAGKLESVLKAIDDGRLSPQAAHRVMASTPGAFERAMQAELDAAVAAVGQELADSVPPPPAVSYTLVGPELAAYLKLRAAASAAHAAQQTMATTAADLREAMQAWGAVVAPGKDPT